MNPSRATALNLAFCVVLSGQAASAQQRDAAGWTAHVASEYDITSNVTYLVAGSVDLKLDVYTPRGLSAPNAVVVYYHGGGWAGGDRERAVLRLLPYLEMGFTVVNATYRGARTALAPAVPYRQATRLHAELTKRGVVNELVTVSGGGHGGFTREQNERSYAAIRAFLAKLGLLGVRDASHGRGVSRQHGRYRGGAS